MFVDIENFKSALAVENILTPYKKGRLSDDKKTRLPKEKITPDTCMEILKSTNYARNIKDMLECIKELPAHEQAQFKDVVLSTFDNREQPNDILVLGKKLAVASGFEAELSEAQKLKDGEFLHSSSNLDKAFVSLKDSFEDVDFSAYDKVICLSDKEIQFLEGVKFPKHLGIPNSSDVSFASYFRRNANFLASGSDFTGLQSMRFKDGAKVDFSKAKNLPSQLDVSMCSVVYLRECDLSGVQSMRFKEGAKVNLSKSKNLPADIDVSMCADVRLLQCDLKDQPNLRFKDGARVDLSKAQNLTPQLDVSTCSELELMGCDLSQHNLRFREGASVMLEKIQNIPVCPDFSMCQKVVLYDSDFKNYSNLCFKNGAIVCLEDAKNLLANVDFSQCSEVTLAGCDLKNQPNLCFQNGAKVELREVKNLSSDADFSQCDVVKLSGKILNDKSQLRFKEGAEVMFHWIEFHSAQLDVSMCSQIKFLFCDFKDMDCLIFKNREQMKASEFQRPDKWKGKLIFTDEQQLLQAGKEIDMKKNVSAKDEEGSHGADEKSSAHKRWGGFVGKLFGKGSR